MPRLVVCVCSYVLLMLSSNARAQLRRADSIEPGVTVTEKAVPIRSTSTLVWQGEKVNAQGSVSPDGRYISFVDWDTGDLCLHDLISAENRTLVSAGNPRQGQWKAYAESSRISRDGRIAAYSWFNRSKDAHELWTVNLIGDPQPRRLYAPPDVAWLEPKDWSPDGKSIVAVMVLKDRTTRLGVISFHDGAFRSLKTARSLGASNVFFSPDGKHLAYDLPKAFTAARDVWIMSLSGSKDSPLIASRGDDSVMGWSPDGKYLLFCSDRTGSLVLWAQPIVDGTAQGAPRSLKSDMGLVVPIGITKAGELFYGTLIGRRGGSVYLAGFDVGSGTMTLPHDVSTAAQENNLNPSWSPDGKYLAYVCERGRPGAAPVIVLRFGETGAPARELEPKLRTAELAGWEPGGRALLVVGTDFDGRRGAFRVDAETGDTAFLFAAPPAPTLSMPVWSADGRALYYWSRAENGTVHIFSARDLASGVEREIIRRPFLGQLNVSPDGRWLATETIDASRSERVLLLISLETGTSRAVMRVAAGVEATDLRTVAGKGARVYPTSWAADSRSFLARLQREPEGQSELWRVPVDETAPKRLSSPVESHVFAFKVSPDGRRVAYRYKEPGPMPDAQVWSLTTLVTPNSVRQ